MKIKKNSFMQGAFIATFAIVFCKILGVLYVIPFQSVIGEKGGALYAYAYNIYSIFLSISMAGIPIAMSKVISEYHTLGYSEAKKKAYNIGKWLAVIAGIVCFLILFIFADKIGYLIIGGIEGGNTKEDVALVIRVISTAILIIPLLSIVRGYFQGHRYITETSLSEVIEQLVRVLIIVVGSYLMYNVFDCSLTLTVAVSVFAATVGGLFAQLYLSYKERKFAKEFVEEKKVKEPSFTTKEIFMKILIYALPIVMIELFRTLYNSVDVMMLVKTLVNKFSYSVSDAESIISIISTWGLKINMIVIALVTGLMTSLIPNLTSNLVENDTKGIENRINKTYQIVLFFVIPMTVGLSILAEPVWTIFYGASKYGAIAYRFLVFVALATSLFTSTTMIVQVLKGNKVLFISLILGILSKIVLNVPFMYLFDNIGLEAFYGSIAATIFGFVLPVAICFIYLKKNFKINFKPALKTLGNVLMAVVCMIIVLFIMKLFIPMNVKSRLVAILVTLVYTLVGALVYFGVVLKNKELYRVFDIKDLSGIKKRFLKRK